MEARRMTDPARRELRVIRNTKRIEALIRAADLRKLEGVSQDLFRAMCIGEATEEELSLFLFAESGRYAILSYLCG
jgi:hypothetical protein